MHQSQTQRFKSIEKDLEEAFFVKEGETYEMIYQRIKMLSFRHSDAMANRLTECLTIQLQLTPRNFMDQDYAEFKEN